MSWLSVEASLGDHRYTLDASLTRLAVIGGAASLLLAAVMVLRRRGETPQGWAAPAVAGGALVVSSGLALFGGPAAGGIAGAFPGTYACDVGAVVIAGLAAVVVALRARAMKPLTFLLPAWLLAQCGVVHARSMHAILPHLSELTARPIQVGRVYGAQPVVSADEPYDYAVSAISLSPHERGRHEVIARAVGDRLRVERTYHFDAVEERGDPLLPLQPGNHWLLRSADGKVEATITVGSSEVEDGLRLHEVTVTLKAGDESKKITLGGPERVYEAGGRVFALDGSELIKRGDARPERQEISCRIGGLLQCACAETVAPPTRLLPGPASCHGTYPNGAVEMLFGAVVTIASLGQADTSGLSTSYFVDLVRSGPRGSTP